MRGNPWIYIFVLLFGAGAGQWLGAADNVQGEGPTTQPVTTTRPDTLPVGATRPADTLERGLKSLRSAQTAGSAALQAREIYATGPAARTKLLEIVSEKSLPDNPFRGIVETFEFERDRSILPALISMYGATESPRDRYLTERFKEFDQQDSMLEVMLTAIEGPIDGAANPVWLRLLAEIVDTPAERRQATRALIALLQNKKQAAIAADILQTLQRVTFHDFTQVQAWQQWFDKFSQDHADGFTEHDLYSSALQERDQRFMREVRRNIGAAIQAKQAPADYFDAVRYPEPSIRQYAAKQCRELRDSEIDVVRPATRVLIDALKTERHEETAAVLLETLGELGQAKNELKVDIAPVVVARLTSRSATMVTGALKAIAQVGSEKDCKPVEDVYHGPLAGGDDGAPIRVQVVTTLYRLNCGYGTIVAALSDPSPEVRSNAARVLQYGKQASASGAIAQALRTETKPDPQLAMVRAVVALQSTSDDVVSALLLVAAKPGPAREPAVRGLVQALAGVDLQGARAAEVVNVVGSALPAVATTAEVRTAVIAELQAVKKPIAGSIVAKWLELEPQLDAAKELALLLARVAATDLALLEQKANALIAASRPGPAVALLHAALEFLSGPGAGAGQRAQIGEFRVLLAKALLGEKTPEGLKEAEELATGELKTKPQDGQLLVLRGTVRELLGRRGDAAEDLAQALRTESVVMTADDRREIEKRVALDLLEAGNAAAAEAFLAKLTDRGRDRDLLVILGRVEIANGHGKLAATHFKQALDAPGRTEPAIVRFHLASALLRSPLADDRNRARAIVDELKQAGPNPDLPSLAPLDQALAEDVRLRDLARSLDEAPGDGFQQRLREVVNAGPAVATWLHDGLAEVAKMGPAGAAERRIEAIRAIFKSDEFNRAMAIPAAGAPRDEWVACAQRIVTRWAVAESW